MSLNLNKCLTHFRNTSLTYNIALQDNILLCCYHAPHIIVFRKWHTNNSKMQYHAGKQGIDLFCVFPC